MVATPRRALKLPLVRLPHLRADSLLDRIVRGRAWIPMLAVMLVGIVAMQVEVLKLGASVGRSMNTATELQSQIQLERAAVSTLGSPSRIERLAGSMGLEQPGPTDYHFVSAGTSVQKAIAGIHPVNPSGFDTNLSSERAIDDVTTPTAAAAAQATDASSAPNAADAAATGSTAAAQNAIAAGAAADAGAPTDSTDLTPADAAAATGTPDSAAAAPADTPDAAASDSPAVTDAPATSGGGALAAAAAATSGTSGTVTP